jgi:CBS domain-containing protein
MSPVVKTVDLTTGVTDAHELMKSKDIRHLPVTDEGRLVGMVSQRDLDLLQSFPMIEMGLVSVADAMSEAPYTVDPETPVNEVAGAMARTKIGSAIVAKDGEIVGIFTTIDALRLLDEVLTRD